LSTWDWKTWKQCEPRLIVSWRSEDRLCGGGRAIRGVRVD
jgi:hypothetical protein